MAFPHEQTTAMTYILGGKNVFFASLPLACGKSYMEQWKSTELLQTAIVDYNDYLPNNKLYSYRASQGTQLLIDCTLFTSFINFWCKKK